MKTHKKLNPISRRDFISRAAIGSAAMSFLPLSTVMADSAKQLNTWPKDAEKYKFYMIGHGHIDPVWLWPWNEGISVVHSTFRSALDRMNETPDFVFTSSSAQFYQWVAENDPMMLNEIRRRVDEGRWNIVGGWWIEPDMNIPSGEAMVRQGLYGQLTFQRLLGHRAKVAFNPDAFGHVGSLPQIIKSQGMQNYVFMRPAPHEKTLPADLFWWEGIDGTRVLTYRIQYSYNENGSVRRRLEQISKGADKEPMNIFMAFYGVGDHGGGPTKENIASIEELKREKSAPTVLYGTVDRYFIDARADNKLVLPTVKDDLQHHAVGCYSVESAIKKNNRLAETALVTAEKIASVGSVVWGVNYKKDELTAAWKRLLFLQFHDSLAGTSLFEHSQAANEGYGYALDIAHQTTYLAVQKLEWQIPAEDPDSEYIVVFNPHSWEMNGYIEYDLGWKGIPESSRVENEKSEPLPHQWTAGQSQTGRKGLLIRASIPPMGYRQLRIMSGDPGSLADTVKAENNILENKYLKVLFSNNGSISIFDKLAQKEVFSGGKSGCKAIVIDDPSDTWSHDVKSFSKEIGYFDNAIVKIMETGPVRATIRVISFYGKSVLTIDWILHSGSRNLEAKVSLNWHEQLKMLKFSFPVDVDSPVATYETSYGHIVRQTNGDEDPGQRWVDVGGKRGSNNYGLTVINDAKYGYSVSGNDLRVSVVRSPAYAHHDPKKLNLDMEQLWMDQGIQTFGMMLAPHADTWKENNTVRIAEEFTARPVIIYQGIHPGSLPKSGSFLTVDTQNITIPSVKKSEEGDDIIVRCIETTAKPCTASIDMPFAGCKWTGDFRANEIKTLRINLNTKNIKEVNLLEE